MDLDLETVAGLKTYLARALLKLGQMPFDVRVANSIGQLAQTQRGLVEVSELESRIRALEEYAGRTSSRAARRQLSITR